MNYTMKSIYFQLIRNEQINVSYFNIFILVKLVGNYFNGLVNKGDNWRED